MHRIQTIAVILTTAVSITAFVALLLLYGGMQRGVALAKERGGAQVLVVPRQATEYLTDADLLFTGVAAPVYMDSGMVEQIANIKGVKRVAAQFYGQTLAESCCSTSNEIRIIGIDASHDWLIGPFASYPIDQGLGTDEVLIGRNVSGFESGSGSLLGHKVRVVANLEPSGTDLDNAVFMNIDRLRELVAGTAQLQHFWDTYGSPQKLVSAILLDYEEGQEPYIIKNKIEAQGVRVVERSQAVADSTRQLQVVFAVMLVAGSILALASLLQFIARFYSLVWERKSEMALYRALGATRKNLKVVIGGEALIITGTGALCGVIIGLLLFQVMFSFTQSASAFPFTALPPWTVAGGVIAICLVFFCFAACAIVMPLRQVNRLDPATVMQQVDIG
jgi:putative ABC transport system permease protein